MTRLDRIIKAFNDYDNFAVKNSFIGQYEELGWEYTSTEEYAELTKLRNEVSLLIGELKRYGCRKKDWCGDTMTWKEAIKYCETHECNSCIAYNKPDCRTEYDKTILHAPCFINLVDENLRGEIYKWKRY